VRELVEARVRCKNIAESETCGYRKTSLHDYECHLQLCENIFALGRSSYRELSGFGVMTRILTELVFR